MAGFLICGVTQGWDVEWLVDTGASTSLFSLKKWEWAKGDQQLVPARMRITCIDGGALADAGGRRV